MCKFDIYFLCVDPLHVKHASSNHLQAYFLSACALFGVDSQGLLKLFCMLVKQMKREAKMLIGCVGVRGDEFDVNAI